MALDPEMLQPLQYPEAWLEYGLLDEALVCIQLDAYRRGDDRCTEHYRGAAFRALLARRTFDDLLVQRYLTLAMRDPDPGMARAAVFELMEHLGLTEGQLEEVARCPLCDPRFLARTRLLRALRDVAPSHVLLQACVDSREQRVHRALLRLPELDLEWVRQLAERGATRALRNQAAARLRQGKPA
jgi:hypothetical protein